MIFVYLKIMKEYGLKEDQEKKLWVKKAESELIDFLDDTIYNLDLPELSNCKISNQYGVVKQSGNLDLSEFCKSSSLFFQQNYFTKTRILALIAKLMK